MEPLRTNSVVRFGTFEVSLQSGEVRKGGLRIRVQQQPMKLLEILLEHPGEVVTREELRSRVWPSENFGDFDQALNIAIGKLRSALGDSAESPDSSKLFQNAAIALLRTCPLPTQMSGQESRNLRLEIPLLWNLRQSPGI